MPVYCKDCFYYDGLGAVCRHPNNVSLISGEIAPIQCIPLRNDANKCGPEGRWFTAKGPELPPMPPMAA